MENNPLRGLFGVSSPRPEEQRVSPQPTEPTENIYYEIPSGMIEKPQANPYAGDGTLLPDMHLIYVDEVCGLFKLAGMSEDYIKKKVFESALYRLEGGWIGDFYGSLQNVRVMKTNNEDYAYYYAAEVRLH